MAILPRRTRAIPSSDAASLRRASVRTSVVRLLLAVAACALLAGAFLSARNLDPGRSELVPGGKSGVVVLDLSLSITDRDYPRVRTVLERLIAAGTPMGLVVFSDVPYELLPPRTPARELRPLLRFLTPDGDRLPRNPWTLAFQAGTRISAALQLAQRMLRRDGVSPGSIILVSDLETAPNDFSDLGRTLTRLRRSPTAVRIVPLSPTSDGLNFFQSLLGRESFVDPVEPSPDKSSPFETALRGQAPLWLLVIGGLVFLALAAHERFAGRLALPRGAGWRGS